MFKIVSLCSPSDQTQQVRNWDSLLKSYFDSGQTYFEAVPQILGTEFDLEEWLAEKDIDELKATSLSNLAPSSGLKNVSDDLSKKFAFVRQSMEAITRVLNAATAGHLVDILLPQSEERSVRAEKALLTDQLISCQHEVITLKAELKYLERKVRHAERALYHCQLSSDHSTHMPSSSLPQSTSLARSSSVTSIRSDIDSAPALPLSNGALVSSTSLLPAFPPPPPSLIPLHPDREASVSSIWDPGVSGIAAHDMELMNTLRIQVNEAISKQSQAEKSLTSYIAQTSGMVGSAEEVNRMNKFMVDIRRSCNKRLAEMQSEVRFIEQHDVYWQYLA